MGIIWDSNEQNMVEPSQALFDDGYAIDAIPTSANFNWLLNNLTAYRNPVGSVNEYTADYASLDIESGWLPMNGSTVGSTASSATYANDRYKDLYIFMWTNIAGLTVSGGKGGSALADWDANKTITLPDASECVFAGAGTGTPPTPPSPFFNPVGSIIGANEHVLTEDELPIIQPNLLDPGHAHSYQEAYDVQPQRGDDTPCLTLLQTSQTSTSTTGITVESFGGGEAHSIVQQSFVGNSIIKW